MRLYRWDVAHPVTSQHVDRWKIFAQKIQFGTYLKGSRCLKSIFFNFRHWPEKIKLLVQTQAKFCPGKPGSNPALGSHFFFSCFLLVWHFFSIVQGQKIFFCIFHPKNSTLTIIYNTWMKNKNKSIFIPREVIKVGGKGNNFFLKKWMTFDSDGVIWPSFWVSGYRFYYMRVLKGT